MSSPIPTPALRSAISEAIANSRTSTRTTFDHVMEAITPFLAPAPVEQARGWNTGTPDVKEGGCETFWCCIENAKGKLFHRHLDYANRHIMPLADGQEDAPEGTEPVPNSEEDFYWTGWHEVACDQCDTQWRFSQKVVAWMRLPEFAHFQSLATENKDSENGCEGCSHRWWVQADPYGSSISGWGCRLTGGHAIKRCSGFARAATGKGQT